MLVNSGFPYTKEFLQNYPEFEYAPPKSFGSPVLGRKSWKNVGLKGRPHVSGRPCSVLNFAKILLAFSHYTRSLTERRKEGRTDGCGLHIRFFFTSWRWPQKVYSFTAIPTCSFFFSFFLANDSKLGTLGRKYSWLCVYPQTVLYYSAAIWLSWQKIFLMAAISGW